MVPVIIRDMYPRECGAGEGGSQSQCDKDVFIFIFCIYYYSDFKMAASHTKKYKVIRIKYL